MIRFFDILQATAFFFVAAFAERLVDDEIIGSGSYLLRLDKGHMIQEGHIRLDKETPLVVRPSLQLEALRWSRES
jgi:hypothetical protein